jgi:glycosyltransferase involved in cell wall biosynthesis
VIGRTSVDMVVVVNGFPRLSETFVLHELLDLERRGVRLHIVALRQPEESVQQEALEELRAKVTYAPDLMGTASRLVVRAAHGGLLLRRRTAYLDGVTRVVASPDFSRTSMDRAAVIAHLAVRLGARSMYLHFAHKPATLGRFAALLAGLPYALSAHAKDIWCTPAKELTAKVRDAQVVLTCTEEGRARLAELAGSHTRVVLAPHGVDAGRPRRSGPANDVPVVLSVGRLVEKKGHDTLIRAAAMMRDHGVEVRVRIAGEGPEWPTLQRLVHQLDVADRISFLGPLTPVEVESEYLRADVFALGCRILPDGDRDGIPNVLLEAMAHGLPVISTTLAGVREAVIHGSSGLLCDPDDAAGMAMSLTRLARSPELRVTMGRAGRTRIANAFSRVHTLPVVHRALLDAGLVPSTRHPEATDDMRRAA